MRKLDKTRRFGEITGNHEAFPNARFEQDGCLFDSHGDCLTSDGKTKYDSKKDKSPTPDPGAAVRSELEQAEKDVKEARKVLKGAEDQLAKAEKGDESKPEYTSNMAEAQRAVTNAKRTLTKLVNQAAVLEQKVMEND